MTEVEYKAWNSFALVMSNFLVKKKSYDHVELVESMLSNLQELGPNVSIEINILHLHLKRFPQNRGDLGDERCERFHQDFRIMEDRYQGLKDTHMIADCWSNEIYLKSFVPGYPIKYH